MKKIGEQDEQAKVFDAEGNELLLDVGADNGAGGDSNDKGAGLGEEEASEESSETLDDTKGNEEEEENLDLDWKEARAQLKDLDGQVGYSIDDYDKRQVINGLKTRFNDKERTQSLFDAIMTHE